MSASQFTALARFRGITMDHDRPNPVKLFPFNPDPMPTPIAPVTNPVKLFPFNPDPMPTPITPVEPSPVSATLPLHQGFVLSIDKDGNIVCADVPLYGASDPLPVSTGAPVQDQYPVEDTAHVTGYNAAGPAIPNTEVVAPRVPAILDEPLYNQVDVLHPVSQAEAQKPTAVGIQLNDGGFVLTMNEDGTITCGGAPAEGEETSARPIANPEPGHPLICLPFEGILSPVSEAAANAEQAAIDKFIYAHTQSDSVSDTHVGDQVATFTATLNDLLPVNAEV